MEGVFSEDPGDLVRHEVLATWSRIDFYGRKDAKVVDGGGVDG